MTQTVSPILADTSPQMQRFCQYFVSQIEGDHQTAQKALDDMIELDGLPEECRESLQVG